MPTDDQQVLVTGVASAPASFTIPGNGQIQPKSVYATFDGSGAAAAFYPALKVISDGGEVVGIYTTVGAVAAGGSAAVSWFPGVGNTGAGSATTFIGARLQASFAPQTIHRVTGTDLTYSGVNYDTDAMADLAVDNRILTVNTPGWYAVTARCRWEFNGTGRRILVICKSGFYSSGTVPSVNTTADNRNAIWTAGNVGANSANHAMGIFPATTGDFFSTGVYQAAGGDVDVNGADDCYLEAWLIGV